MSLLSLPHLQLLFSYARDQSPRRSAPSCRHQSGSQQLLAWLVFIFHWFWCSGVNGKYFSFRVYDIVYWSILQVKTGMTMTEKILARASEKTHLSPGDNVWVNIDVLMTHDVCGPGTFGIFKKEFGQNAKVNPFSVEKIMELITIFFVVAKECFIVLTL